MSWSKEIVAAEEQARLTAEQINRMQQPALTQEPAIMRTNRSLRVEVDLTVAHNITPLKLTKNIVYRWITIEGVGSPFTYSLKSPNGVTSTPFSGIVGATVVQHDFLEIYITNIIGVGTAVFQVGWRE